MKRYFTRLCLINKRLFLTGTFLILLAMIPLSAVLLTAVSTAEKGILTIAIAAETELAPFESEVTDENTAGTGVTGAKTCIDRLKAQSRIIRFLDMDSGENAMEAVERGKADAAWVFVSDYDAVLKQITAGQSGVLVNVYAPEDTVFLKLAREKLFAAIYPDLSHGIFRSFLLNDLPAAAGNTEHAGTESDAITEADSETLDEYYLSTVSDRSLIRFSFIDSEEDNSESISEDYLLLPVRGILAIIIFASGIASSIFFLEDERKGCFIPLSKRGRTLMISFYTISGVFWTAAVSMVALYATGTFTSIGHELFLMFFYLAAVCGMSDILRLLLRRTGILATALPVFIVLMLSLCPVFLNFRTLPAVSALLPAFHYLHGVNSVTSARNLILCAGGYVVGYMGLSLILSYLKETN